MTARYLIRLDDACPTMDRDRWYAIETLLDRQAVRPIVAVVPDNRDPELMRSPADPNFWNRVRRWEAKGWSIAMHGLHHLYHAVDRRRLILPFYDRSEFGGLDYPAQAALIRQSWTLFAAHGIAPTVWIAPGHSFDRITVQAVYNETPIRLISDGLSIDAFHEDGFAWVPQQLWGPQPRRRGIWTICLHPNTMDAADIARLGQTLSEPFYRERVAALSDLKLPDRRKGLMDHGYRRWFLGRSRVHAMLLPLYRAGRRLWTRRTGSSGSH